MTKKRAIELFDMLSKKTGKKTGQLLDAALGQLLANDKWLSKMFMEMQEDKNA